MIFNIFLFKGKNFTDLDNLNYYYYPEDVIKIDDKDLIGKIIYGHDHGDLIRKYRNGKKKEVNLVKNKQKSVITYLIDTPISQVINENNIYTTCINGKIIVGLIFEKEDNPYDYKDALEELLNDYLNVEKHCNFNDEIDIENFLITLFIDLRRHGDENVKISTDFNMYYQDGLFHKVFLFGIDEVGKTSLVRRIKTGEFDDNFFLPTRKFSIEYIQNEIGAFSFWDMPGQRLFRKKWLLGLQDSNVILYVVDIANQIRFQEAKKELWKVLNLYDLTGVPLLILGNKIDLIDQSNESNENHLQRLKDEIFNYFDFHKIIGREWKFLFTSVKTNLNVEDVLKSISKLI